MLGLNHILSENPYTYFDAVNAFFFYSFFGWVMECIVIRRERGIWENRGFVHLPFCIIYGFGAMLGFVVLRPLARSYPLLFLVGAILATVLEYITGRLMLHLFGRLWWDYSGKPFNYQGIVCLESTIGWGIISVLLFAVLHRTIFFLVTSLSRRSSVLLATTLTLTYLLDFAYSAYAALERPRSEEKGESEEQRCDPS